MASGILAVFDDSDWSASKICPHSSHIPPLLSINQRRTKQGDDVLSTPLRTLPQNIYHLRATVAEKWLSFC
jgi:hypothetical protein